MPCTASNSLSARAHRRLGRLHFGRDRRHRLELVRAEVVADRQRDDEVAVGQALHQRARAEPVRAVIGEVCFTDHVQPGDGAHEIVVHPEAAHRVVHGRVDAHRHFVRILIRDAFIHLEQIPVPLGDLLLAEALDGVAEVEIDAATARPDTAPFVAHFFRGARRDVARRQIAEARILALEIVVAIGFGNAASDVLPQSSFRFGTQTRPSLRSDSLISVSLD